MFPYEFEGFEAVEAGKIVIGEDDVKLMSLESPRERFPGFSLLDAASGKIRHQSPENELGIDGIIFKVKNAYVVSHPTSRFGWASNYRRKRSDSRTTVFLGRRSGVSPLLRQLSCNYGIY
jgi:hypothetical protein